MKIDVKVKSTSVQYYDFEFYNKDKEKLLYCCTAPTFDLAYKNFKRYTEFTPVTLLSCTTDGQRYRLER